MKPKTSWTIFFVLVCWIFGSLTGANASKCSAQVPRTTPDTGFIAFDFNTEAILKSRLAKPFLDGFVPKSVKIDEDFSWVLNTRRVSGIIGIPKDIASLGNRPHELVDFFVSVEFFDSKTLEESFMLTTANLKPIEFGGKKFFGDRHRALLIHKKNKVVLETGTRSYMLHPRVFDAASDELKGLWKRMPNTPLKIAVDAKNAKPFLSSIKTEIASKQPWAETLIAAFENTNAIILTGNPNAPTILKMTSFPVRGGSVEKIDEGYDTLKQWAQTMVEDASSQDENLLSSFRPFVEGIEYGNKNGSATFEINKPKRADEIAKRFVSVKQRKEKKAATIDRIRQAMIAANTFETGYEKFPFKASSGHMRAKFGNISWRVLVLGQFRGNDLNKQFDIQQDWDSPKNKPLAAKAPFPFGTDGKTDICWVNSPNLVSDFNSYSIRDGTSNTIALIQNPSPVDWTAPGDLTPDEVVEIVTKLPDGEQIAAVFYDGSAIWISNQCDIRTLRNALDPRDGKTVDKRRLTVTNKSKALASTYPKKIKQVEKLYDDGQFETAIKTLEAMVAIAPATQIKIHELLIRNYIELAKIHDATFDRRFRKMLKQRQAYNLAIKTNLDQCMELDSQRTDIKHLVASYTIGVGNITSNRVAFLPAAYDFNEILEDESYCEKNPVVIEEALKYFDHLGNSILQIRFRELLSQRLLSESKRDLEPKAWQRNLSNVTRYYLLIDNLESAESFLLEKKKQSKGSPALANDNRAMESWNLAMASVYRRLAKKTLDLTDGDPVKSLEYLRKANELDSSTDNGGDLESRSLIFRASTMVSRNPKAAEVAAELYDPNADLNPPTNAAIFFSRQLANSKKWKEALTIIEHALETNGQDCLLLIELADIRVELGDVEGSVQALKEAQPFRSPEINIEQARARVGFVQGKISLRKGFAFDASRRFQMASRDDPETKEYKLAEDAAMALQRAGVKSKDALPEFNKRMDEMRSAQEK